MNESINCGEAIKKNNRYQPGVFNPFEIAFCGYSGSGKTTLIEKIISSLSKKYSIGFVKHDAHGFEMDKKGKDTFKCSIAGAKGVYINHENESAFLDFRESEKHRQPLSFTEFDMVIVEGYKESIIPKILVLDPNQDILKEFNSGYFTNVIGIVGEPSALEVDVPYFQRDQVHKIEKFVMNYFNQNIKSRPMKGLILTGGKSSRMGSDKSLLNYHGETQVQHVTKQLSVVCDKVFVSVREKKTELYFPQVEDKFLDIGPMGGILSAMREDPEATWLVMACDLPFVTDETLKYLIDHRNPFRNATAFQSNEDEFPEPLCAIYEPKAVLSLLFFLGLGYHCPRKVMINSRVELLRLPNKDWLKNANTMEEFQNAKQELQKVKN